MNSFREKEEIDVRSGAESSGPLERQSVEDHPGAIRGRQAVWIMWWAGTALIVLSWFGVVSGTIGWIGFAAAAAASVGSVVINKYWRMPR